MVDKPFMLYQHCKHRLNPLIVFSCNSIVPTLFSYNSRLCCVAAVCEELIKLRGLDILVALCKDGSLRNYNDAVLVACLAVLRRVANHCGHQVFDELEARDLIDPKLMDSFLEYSSKQESYV